MMGGRFNGGSQGYPPSAFQQHSQQPQPHHPQQSQPQQQQHQPQQQQLANVMNGNQQAGTSTDGQSQAASGPSGGQEMNLASVLHYLQSEWRRWERDRNEWEIERAEMRARIALLEGQRRSAENLKVDLLRRVKMLEFALRQERSKGGSTLGKTGTIAPSRLIALQDEDRMSNKDDKELSGSEGSEEGASERPKINGGGSVMKPLTIAGRAGPDTSAWKGIGGVPRDPKSRARSREYLKQCLQEITYLTSPGALNPLPARPPVSVNDPSSPADATSSNDPNRHHDALSERPQKELPNDPPPSLFAPKVEVKTEPEEPQSSQSGSSDLPNGIKQEPRDVSSSNMAIEPTARPPSSPAVRTMELPESEANGEEEEEQKPEGGAGSQLLTAIYRPESKAAWREELRAANEKAEKIRAQKTRSAEPSDEEQLASLSLSIEDEEIKGESSGSNESIWVTRRSLKSHLDVVRTVSFAQGSNVMVASGGDDNTVKVWSLESTDLLQRRSGAREIEPIVTYRGHTAPVTSVLISSARSAIYSASLDCTIRIWRLPASNQDPYGEFDPSDNPVTLEGHTDAIWSLAIVPYPQRSGSKRHRLVSASSDGSIKVWQIDGQLVSSFTFDGAIPTCVEAARNEGKVLVGFTNGMVIMVDVDNDGETLVTYGEELEDAQVNSILYHAILNLVIVGHEDGHIRVYNTDWDATSPVETILAHPGPVTSLALHSTTPTSIFTASTDCTVRLWNLPKKTSIQELAGHRKRADEGVCAIASHPDLPIVASAGADGVVRLWASS